MKKALSVLILFVLSGSIAWADPVCDVNDDGKVGTEEAIYALQVEADLKSAGDSACDVNNDGEPGLEEAVYALQITSGAYPNEAPYVTDVAIAGDAVVGSTLTGQYIYNDSDSDTELGSNYIWLRYDDAACTTNETVIGYSITYALTGSEEGKWIKFRVTPVAQTGISPGITEESSAFGSIAPANTAPVASNVSITGTLEVGYTLSGSYIYYDADLDEQGNTAYRWLRYDDSACTTGETVIGTDSTYLLTSSEEGKWIKLEVTPVAQSGESPGVAVECGAVGTIAKANTAPVASNVSITGTLEVGYTLSSSYTYYDADLDEQGTATYRWSRFDDSACTTGETVIGTGSTYLLTALEEGKWIKLEVTPVATSGVSPGNPVTSAATGAISKANTAPYATDVSISGTQIVSYTLTGSYTYNDDDADAEDEGATSFRWLRYDDEACTINETVIGSSTTYVLTDSDEEKWIKFEVTPASSSGVSPGSSVQSSAIGEIAGLIPSDYIFRWKLNNNGNDDKASLHLSSSNGAPAYSTSSPKEGSHYLNLNGSSDIYSPSPYNVSTNAITISMWLYLNASNNDNYPTAIDLGGGLGIWYDKPNTKLRGGITFSQTGDYTSFTKGTWYHVVMTSDANSDVKLYIDGNSTPVGSWGGSYNITGYNSPWYVGSCAGGDRWDGYIDDVIIYDRTLNGSEVSNIFDSY